MNLEEKKADLNKRLKNVESSAATYKEELKLLETKTQPTNAQLHDGLSSYVDILIGEGEYTHVLGGDGRSRAWSEQRTGIVASLVVFPMYYLSSDQLKMVKRWVNDIHSPDHVELKTNP